MIANNPVHEVCDYGSQALYRDLPSPEQIRAGVVPLDSLPATWWNAMWNDTNKAVNEARGAIGIMVNELCNVLVGAGICPSCSCLDQLYQSIDKLRQTLATAAVAGAVKSSSNCGEVSVDGTTGIMTANGLGNAAQLATSARTTVGAINELKQIYDCCISDINTCTGSLGTGKAPTMHAAATTDYGVGNATCYGHVRLSDTFDTVLADCSGVAASQYALATAYQCLIACSGAPLGNTVGCALGTAAAGSASTAARSDHVHPLPSCVMDKYGDAPIGIGYSCTGLTCAQIAYLAAYSINYCTGCTIIKDACKDNVKSWLGTMACATNATYAKQLSACDSTTVCVVAEGGNELNIKPKTSTGTWINYRGGAASVAIGNGGGHGCYGNLSACCVFANTFCGTLCGIANRAVWAGCTCGAAWCACRAYYASDALCMVGIYLCNRTDCSVLGFIRWSNAPGYDTYFLTSRSCICVGGSRVIQDQRSLVVW